MMARAAMAPACAMALSHGRRQDGEARKRDSLADPDSCALAG